MLILQFICRFIAERFLNKSPGAGDLQDLRPLRQACVDKLKNIDIDPILTGVTVGCSASAGGPLRSQSCGSRPIAEF